VVSCLDSGPFFVATIAGSVTVDCPGGVIATVIIDGPGIAVTLRNMTINSVDPTLGFGSDVGVDFRNGSSLRLENVKISGIQTASPGGPAGIGLRFAPPSGVTAKLHVIDSDIADNGLTNSGGGIVIQPAGSGSARVVIERTRVENNTYGIFANGMESTGVIAVQLADTSAANNTFNGISAFTAAGKSTTSITVDRSSSKLNGQAGILAQSAPAFVILGNSTVMGNGIGLNTIDSGNILSYGNNQLAGNIFNGAPKAVLTLK
jgi:hypothetical protein